MGEPYQTKFCGKNHDLADGKPIGHSCYVLPVRALRCEKEGDHKTAKIIIQGAKPLRVHPGKRLQE